MSQQTVQVYKPKSGAIKTSQEIAPVMKIYEEIRKLEGELMDSKNTGKALAYSEAFKQYAEQLKQIIRGGKAAGSAAKQVMKYTTDVVRKYVMSHLELLSGTLAAQLEPGYLGEQRKALSDIGKNKKDLGQMYNI